MIDESRGSTAELTPRERSELIAWAQPEIAPDFAAAVVGAWQAERTTTQRRPGSSGGASPEFGWGVAVAATLLAASLVAWLAGVAWRSDALSPDEPASGGLALHDTRHEAHAVLDSLCTPCHHSGVAHAQPEALAIFDLAQPQWWTSPTEQQLGRMLERVGDSADEIERERIERFVATELQVRRASP